MKILVTGGAGFIGSCFVRLAVQNPSFEVINVDKLTYAGNLENLASIAERPNYTFIKADLCDLDGTRRIFEETKPEAVVHFAAESHVDRSIFTPQPVFETNLRGSFNLLESMRACRVRRFIHVSTDEVYGSLEPPLEADENFPLQPSSPYSAAKAGSDLMALAYYKTYKLPVIVTRASNNYGPYHFPEKLIPLMIINALEGRPLPVYGRGENIRDWLFVEDHAEALLLAAKEGTSGATYNVGGGSERRNIDIVEAICDLVDTLAPNGEGPRRKLISFVADRPGHDQRYAIDANRIKSELGWQPRHDLEKGLRKTVEWYLANRDWWEAIRSGTYRGERLGLAV